MRSTTKQRLWISLLFSLALLVSCNLDDFNTDRLSRTGGLNPVVYLPIAKGDYIVKDHATILQTGNLQVTDPLITFTPITYDLTGLSYNTTMVDSALVIVKITNGTPMQLRFHLSFSGHLKSSQWIAGALLDAGGNVREATVAEATFQLTAQEFKDLGTAPSLQFTFELQQPTTGKVLASILKNSSISLFMSAKAPVKILLKP